MKLITIVLIVTILTTVATAQDQTVEIVVKVVDKKTNKPIDHANVLVVGTTRGTVTNAMGFFKLILSPSEKKINISHVSYESQLITVPEGLTSFTVPLELMAYSLPPCDLRLFPTNFSREDLKSKPVVEDLRTDSLIVVESLADFPFQGGVNTFVNLFGNEFQFPEKELLERTEGKLILGFVIDKNGDYKNVRCLFGGTGGLCAEVERIISKMPRWTPGEQRGDPAEQTFTMVVYYGMNDHWNKKARELKKKNRQS